MNRICAQCSTEKPLIQFYRHPKGKDGRYHICKVCHRQNVSENRAFKVIYYREKDRERNKLPHRKALTAAWMRSEVGRQYRRQLYRWKKLEAGYAA